MAALERRWNVSARQHGTRWRLLTALRRLPGWHLVAERPPSCAMWVIERIARTRDAPGAVLPAPSQAARERLAGWLAPDADRLRGLTGRTFASWTV